METTAINENMIPKSENRKNRWTKTITAGVLVVWLALVLELGASGSIRRAARDHSGSDHNRSDCAPNLVSRCV